MNFNRCRYLYWSLMCIAWLGFVACGPGNDTGTGDSTGTDNGQVDEGGTDEGGTDEGGTDEGGTDEGGTDEGGTDEGGTDEGTGDPCDEVDCDAPPENGSVACVNGTCEVTCNDFFELDGELCVDVDECATDNGGCGDVALFRCINNEGSAPVCEDIDECATDNGGCGDAAFWTCTNNDGAAPTCEDIDECATDNGGCGDAALYTCVNNEGAAPTCEDVDECATDNGGCGDAAYWTCTNNDGAVATCEDIDECATDNGGCGDVAYWTCTNNEGVAATCEDIDECATDNGGCGDPSAYICTNNEGAAPTCEMVACTGNESWIGDGWCDGSNNNASCSWDGGDCCESACVDGFYSCGANLYDCIDPNSCENTEAGCGCLLNNGGCGDSMYWTCADDVDGVTCSDVDECATDNGGCGDPAMYTCTNNEGAAATCDEITCDGNENWIDDGYCDPNNNSGPCAWDGGDCCQSTNPSCATSATYPCDCQDPNSCEGQGGDVTTSGDGTCDAANNNALCGYDGGDCCNEDYATDGYCDDVNNNDVCGFDGGDCCGSTCENGGTWACGSNGFNCLNPDACDMYEGSEYLSIGDGTCNSGNNIEQCNYDGGDCCNESWDGDGYCDGVNNTPVCGFDSGDCCESANADCATSTMWPCDCQDPAACDSLDDSDFTTVGDESCDSNNNNETCGWDGGDCCNESYFTDSYCDSSNNNAACTYDGGDCCATTCTETGGAFSCGGFSGDNYNCVDPAACESHDGTDYMTIGDGTCDDGNRIAQCTFDGNDCCDTDGGNSGWLTDSYCDGSNNINTCSYDGGDCCESTCVETGGFYSCGDSSYDCINPAACENSEEGCADPGEDPCAVDNGGCGDVMYVTCSDAGDGTAQCDDIDECATDNGGCGDAGSFSCSNNYGSAPTCEELGCAWPTWAGDGYCDGSNNNGNCAWDGGDCCASTCVDGEYTCGGGSGYDCQDPAACDSLEDSDYTLIGNDACNAANNNEVCGYDGGDCCTPAWYGDTMCDGLNNNPVCSFDGGDCCESVNPECGGSTFFPCDCQDPTRCDAYPGTDFSKVDDGICDSGNLLGQCSYDSNDCCEAVGGIGSYLADGYCDSPLNNNAACSYDAGDCCESTCVDASFECFAPAEGCWDPWACENTEAGCSVE